MVNNFNNLIPKTTFYPQGREHSCLLAEGMARVGRFLTRPTELLADGIVRVFVLELKPGYYGQYESKHIERLYRLALVIVGIVIIPFALIGAVLGVPLRFIASFFKGDFVLRFPSVPTESSRHLSLLTFNVHLGACNCFS